MNDMSYTDDTRLVADRLENLQKPISSLNIPSKTLVPDAELLLNNKVVLKVERYTYLGTTLSKTSYHSVVIKCRIQKHEVL